MLKYVLSLVVLLSLLGAADDDSKKNNDNSVCKGKIIQINSTDKMGLVCDKNVLNVVYITIFPEKPDVERVFVNPVKIENGGNAYCDCKYFK